MLEDGRSFPMWLATREDLRADHSLGALRDRVCEDAWNEDRLCYVHVNEGCYSCDSMRRPTRDEWRRHIAERPPSELEQSWIGKYERSMHEWRAATTRGVPRRQYHFRQRSQSPLDSPCRVAMRSPARLDVRYSSRSPSRGRGDTYSPRRSRSRQRSSRRLVHHENIHPCIHVGAPRQHGFIVPNDIWNFAKA